MKISDVSKKTKLTKETLRYYEMIGLISDVNKNASGNRDYSEKNIVRIEFIKSMRSAGIGISTLKEYVALIEAGDSTYEARKKLLLEQRVKIYEKLNEIQYTIEILDYKIENYEKLLK